MDFKERMGKVVRKAATLGTLLAVMGTTGANARSPESTPRPDEFKQGWSVGLDIDDPLEFVVVDENGKMVGPLGDGKFDDGSQVNVFWNLSGNGKVVDFPWGWSAENAKGEELGDGTIYYGDFE